MDGGPEKQGDGGPEKQHTCLGDGWPKKCKTKNGHSGQIFPRDGRTGRQPPQDQLQQQAAFSRSDGESVERQDILQQPGLFSSAPGKQRLRPLQEERQSFPRDGGRGPAGTGGSPVADEDRSAAGWEEIKDTRRGRRRRSVRRSRKPKEMFTDVTIYNTNLNGFNGKKASIAKLLSTIKPTVATFQETAVTGSNKINIKNYLCFQRNRKGLKTMGGVATFVTNDLKQNTVKVKEGIEKDEYIVTRLDHVSPAINIMNVYGGQESRMSKQEVQDNWIRLKAAIREIKDRGEGLVLIGDFNWAVGSGQFGVRGNHNNISYRGEMIRELLMENEYYLINNSDLTEGGPFTWVSRADSSIRSCLDLVILSANLVPFVTRMVVDSKQQYCPKRVGVRKDKTRVVKTDHHPIILSLENLPRKKRKQLQKTKWNIFKPGGWKTYMEMYDEIAKKADEIIENKDLSSEVIMNKGTKGFLHCSFKSGAFHV